jgi:isocitrate dehydrogenase (NAD+)
MGHKVTLIPGDGAGREIAAATQRLVAATGVAIDWEEAPAGELSIAQGKGPLPDDTVEAIRRTRVTLKGRINTPKGAGYENPNVRLRKALNLFAAVRPVKSLRGLPSRYEDVDLVVIRECTEDVYAGIEHQVVPGVIQGLKITTAAACTRIVRFAFDYAVRQGRKKVTLAHKANIMKKSDGLFIRCGEAVAKDYPQIAFDTIIADNACMQMVRNPHKFDVIVAQNLFGDLLSDLGAGLVGGIGGVWSVLRDDTDLHVFEGIHGSAPELAGKGVANPLPLIRPAMRMLRHLGEESAADRVGAAISATLEAGVSTPDLGGTATTAGFTDAVIANLR